MRLTSILFGALVILLAIFVGPETARTQQSESSEEQQSDPGFLERQIQNLLGGEGRTVRVTGLQGALSSEVSIGRIEVADDDGVWLTVENVVLDWRRVALLRRRFVVNSLSVGRVDLSRLPAPVPGDPPALQADTEAQPFSLPQLPVAVNIGEVSIESLSLGMPVLGQAVTASLNGSATLEGGEGNVDLALVRTDGQEGRFTLQAGFDNESRNLNVDLDVVEDAGGLIASLANMPGAPALSLTVTGNAPISDFTAEIVLASDGEERLTGSVEISEETGGDALVRVIQAQLSGDVAELFLPDYRSFFGREVSLDLLVRQSAATGVDIERLNVETRALSLNGAVALSPQGWPERIDLQGRIGTETGLPVVLPLAGPPIQLDRGTLSVSYDRAQGEDLTAEIDADGIMRANGVLIDTIRITADGTLTQGTGGAGGRFQGDVAGNASGLSFTDRALWDATGDRISFDGNVDWRQDGPLSVSGLTLTTDTLDVAGDATVTGLQDGAIAVNGNVSVDAGDLSLFSGLAQQDLAGALSADVTADYNVVSGAFDVTLDGTGQDISVGETGANSLLEGQTALSVAVRRDAEGITLDRLRANGQTIDLTGSASIGPDGWPQLANINGTLGRADGAPVALPVPDQEVTLGGAQIAMNYDASRGDGFTADLRVTDFVQGDRLALSEARIEADGSLTRGGAGAANPVEQLLAQLQASYSGLAFPQDPALTEAAGNAGDLTASLDWDLDGPLTLSNFDVTSGDLTLSGRADITGLRNGTATAAQASGRFATGALQRFAAISGQAGLTGAAGGTFDGGVDLATQFFNLTLDAETTDLAIGTAEADALLEGATQIGLTAARDENGVTLDRLRVQGQAIDLDGTAALAPDFWPRRVDLTGSVGQPDGTPVALPVPDQVLTIGGAEIRLDYDAAQGDGFTAGLVVSDFAQEDGLTLERASFDADGTLTRGTGQQARAVEALTAQVTANYAGLAAPDNPALAEAAGDAGNLSADLDWGADGTLTLDNLDLISGELMLSGEAGATGIGAGDNRTARASLRFDTGSLARFAALSGQQLTGRASGTLDGNVDLEATHFDVTLDAQTQDLAIGSAEADALLDGSTDIGLTATRDQTGTALSRLTIQGQAIDLGGTAMIGPDNWPQKVDIAGRIGQSDGTPVALPVPGVVLTAADLDLHYDQSTGDAFRALVDVTGLAVEDQIRIRQARLQSDGRLERQPQGTGVARLVADLDAALSGVSSPTNGALARALGPQTDLTAALDWDVSGPLTLSSLDLGSGDLSLTAQAVIEGLRDGALKVDGSGDLTTGSLARFSGITGQNLRGTLTAAFDGSFDQAGRAFDVTLDATGNGLATGIPPADGLLGGRTTLALRANGNGDDLTLQRFELNNPELTASGSGRVRQGNGQFDLTARVRDVGRVAADFSGPLSVDTRVNVQDGTWRVDGTLQGPSVARARVTGVVRRPDGQMDVAATGVLPLGLANRLIAPRSVLGNANFDLRLRGRPGLNALQGSVTVDGARIAAPTLRLALEDANLRVNIANGRANVDFGSNLSSGGRITASGPVALTAPFDGDIRMALDAITLEDPQLYTVNLDGNLRMNGPMAGGALISGRIDVDRAEIKVPASFGGGGTFIEVTHIDEPRYSFVTRQRAGVVQESESGGGGGGGPVYPLDISIRAPNQIFIRGRGLDVELGGRLNVQGTTAQPIPSGGFNLQRGRLNILARRLEFDEAQITLQGDLNPYIYMVASSQADGITANIVIEGPIDDPQISFSSVPELPEDEVLAQLFFGKPINELSAFEGAQLVAAINTLRGGRGGLFGRLREGLGVDNIDVQSTQEGTTSVTAGKYLTDRIYTDVSVNTDNTTSISLNYDINSTLRAFGSFDSDGNAGFGFTFERDY